MKKKYEAPTFYYECFSFESIITGSSNDPWWSDAKNGHGGNNQNCWSNVYDKTGRITDYNGDLVWCNPGAN